MENLSIRKATISDSELISDCVIRNALPSLPEIAHDGIFTENSPEKIRTRFDEDYQYYLALFHDSVIGLLGVKEYLKEPNHLYHLFVDKDYRRHGIAKRLWEFYLQQRPADAENQSFRVNSSLMAVDVYKSFGFVEHGEYFEKDYIPCVPMLLSEFK